METKKQNSGALKHPAREAWMDWLYGGLPAGEKARLTAHLAECATCRAEVDRWRNTMRTLDQYALPKRRAPARLPQPVLKWAAAAALVLGVGFALGHFVSPASSRAAYRAALKSEIRAELLADLKQQQQQALEDYAKSSTETRAAENKVIFAAIARVDADRISDFASLRKDLETMAVLTEDSFRKAQQQIVTLASYSQPEPNSPNQ
jgi:anti-sigma factor RsiW